MGTQTVVSPEYFEELGADEKRVESEIMLFSEAAGTSGLDCRKYHKKSQVSPERICSTNTSRRTTLILSFLITQLPLYKLGN